MLREKKHKLTESCKVLKHDHTATFEWFKSHTLNITGIVSKGPLKYCENYITTEHSSTT